MTTPSDTTETVGLSTQEVFMAQQPGTTKVMGLEDVTVTFRGRPAVRGVSFDAYEKEVTALIGPSGSGRPPCSGRSTACTTPSAPRR